MIQLTLSCGSQLPELVSPNAGCPHVRVAAGLCVSCPPAAPGLHMWLPRRRHPRDCLLLVLGGLCRLHSLVHICVALFPGRFRWPAMHKQLWKLPVDVSTPLVHKVVVGDVPFCPSQAVSPARRSLKDLFYSAPCCHCRRPLLSIVGDSVQVQTCHFWLLPL